MSVDILQRAYVYGRHFFTLLSAIQVSLTQDWTGGVGTIFGMAMDPHPGMVSTSRNGIVCGAVKSLFC